MITLLLTGDVMTGRGIDQVLPHPLSPVLHEPCVIDARTYVALAEEEHGGIPAPVELYYPWGDAVGELAQLMPDVRIANLETSITTSDEFARGKSIHYRTSPENAACIRFAFDVCCLANNHVLDFGATGLVDTLDCLDRIGVRWSGAGRNREEAERPAVIELEERGRVLVFAFASPTSGVPHSWAAKPDRPGINLLSDLSAADVKRIARLIERWKRSGDLVVLSLHWGRNWGYEVLQREQRFAHELVEHGGVDVLHGHSSHHVRGIEVHSGRLILYGCGDFLTDYEGIHGYEDYRGDLGLMYFATFDPTLGALDRLRMTPTQSFRFQIRRASPGDALWLEQVLRREGRSLGTDVELEADGRLTLRFGRRADHSSEKPRTAR